MFNKYARFLVLAPMALILIAARGAPMYQSSGISVPSGLTEQEVSRAVHYALLDRKWTIDKKAPGFIVASVSVRNIGATIRLNFNRSTVGVSYVSSNGLSYNSSGSSPQIHKRYNHWVRLVEKSIRQALDRFSKIIQSEKPGIAVPEKSRDVVTPKRDYSM